MKQCDTTSKHPHLTIQTRNFNSLSGDTDLIQTDLTHNTQEITGIDASFAQVDLNHRITKLPL